MRCDDAGVDQQMRYDDAGVDLLMRHDDTHWWLERMFEGVMK